jgi:hypothetical protein
LADSLLRSLVHGTRQVLSAQLVVSVVAIALAGWTLGVTSELMRERDRLRERVVQLEQAMGGAGVVVPPQPAVVSEAAPTQADAYPGEIGLAEPRGGTSDEGAEPNRFGAIFGNLFAPAPPLHVVVLHVRADGDRREANTLATALQEAGYETHIRVMPPRDPRTSGYIYFDGRQSRAAADLVSQFHEMARTHNLAAWTAQLRGVALPSKGEYSADRVDIVLPPLPQEPAPAPAPG